jgi:hypothetical protein
MTPQRITLSRAGREGVGRMEIMAFLLYVGAYIGVAVSGGTFRQSAFWPFYAGRKLGQWIATPPQEDPKG